MPINKKVIKKYIDHLRLELSDETNLEYYLSQHLRVNGLYWTKISTQLIDLNDEENVVQWLKKCYCKDEGAFSPYPGHDAHILSTLSAIQLIVIYGDIEFLKEVLTNAVFYIKNLQLSSGAFKGDLFSEEVDTRFSYNSLHILYYTKKFLPNVFDQQNLEDVVTKALVYLKTCNNYDGGFGLRPGCESHGAQVWTSFASFAIWDKIDDYFSLEELENLKWWLLERQNPDGGLNGRPSKLSDCCYSWWCLASLKLLNYSKNFDAECINLLDLKKLKNFIIGCQDEINGGISDRSGNVVDIFHTCFGLAGMSLIEEVLQEETYEIMDPRFCMTKKIIESLNKLT
ncbi:hypothetical protein QEN19_000839 [Hanseniaspora menglaensis]